MSTRLETATDYTAALARIDALWDAAPGTPDAVELDRLAELVHDYESRLRREALPPARPGEVVAARLRELGWSQRELGRRLGWSAGRVSEVVSGKRALTLAMVRGLAEVLDIPATVLVHSEATEEPPAVWVRVSRELATRVHEQRYLGYRSLDALVESLVTGALAVPTVDLAGVNTITRKVGVVVPLPVAEGGRWVGPTRRAAA